MLWTPHLVKKVLSALPLVLAACGISSGSMDGTYTGVADEVVSAPNERVTRDQWRHPVTLESRGDVILVRYGACEHRAHASRSGASFVDSQCNVTIGDRSWQLSISGTITVNGNQLGIVATGGADSSEGRTSYSYRFSGSRR